MSKKIETTNAGMINGIKKSVEVISQTLGPKGRCVAIQNSFGNPEITRDGATVAKAISLSDPSENIGVSLVKAAATKTEEQAGDSTTTTSILIKEMVEKGERYLTTGSNLTEIKEGMDMAVKAVSEFVKTQSIQVDGDLEKIRKVATISANNDPKIGDLIVEAMEKVGENGVIVADLSSGLETTIEVVEGFKIDRGWASPHFITSPEDGKCVMENPVILVAGEKISSVPQILPAVEASMKVLKGRPLLIFCDDMDENVMTTLVMNVLQGALRCCVVKGIDFGDNRKNVMEDIAVATGGSYICPEYGVTTADVTAESLGGADKVVVSKDSCIIYHGHGDSDDVKSRLAILRKRVDDPGCSDYEKTKYEKRISCLSGGIGIIKAGGASETEKVNRKATIDDAILASKSAISEGVVPGGGSVFLRASRLIPEKGLTPDQYTGYKLVLESLPIVTKTIASNSGASGDVVIERILTKRDPEFGYNAKTGRYVNLLKEGVLDSAKALRVSLENATSAAGMCLLTSYVLTDIPTEDGKQL